MKIDKIGKVTKAQILKNHKRISREIELIEQGGWTAKNKIHKSKKAYTRKFKHKNQ